MKPTTYQNWVFRGPTIVINKEGSPPSQFRKKTGAVVAVVDGTTLKIGWSLCNHKSGDHFNPELAISSAMGRAVLQSKHSLNFTTTNVPTTAEIMKHVPQSALSAIGDTISAALKANKQIKTILIFSNIPLPTTTKTPKPLWTVGV